MPKFGSQEWCDDYVKAINANEAYAEAASWWEGHLVFVLSPSGNLDHEIQMWIGLDHGSCTGAKALTELNTFKVLKKGEKPTGEGIEAEYVYSANYDTVKSLVLFLMDDCCAGNAGVCHPIAEDRESHAGTVAATVTLSS